MAAAHAWWDAFARGDMEALETRTAPALSLVLSPGTRFDRKGALKKAAGHVGSAYGGTTWTEDEVRLLAPGVALATSTAIEGFGKQRTRYRYLTVLEKIHGEWRVSAAQSTRVLNATARLSPAEAGDLAGYVGNYMTPKGVAMGVSQQGDGLELREPAGTMRRLEPIGRDLFELSEPQASNGVLRFLFVREADGRITGLTRLGPEIVTFSRASP